ncbi:type II toxin-antitoxin system VapC family toxin [Nocardioides sp. LHD-245]|uniref:type II toxin-antitoxin system VapC family toxin n=1 Tax=Nocardioides sp. LHD-245 TaxID=3051387 RepID=UPI0027E02A3A|nr:type II toxin-antitoxin system VapC family toxin [Nocardioides sp. LHD-245]
MTTERLVTLVDSNVLLDLATEDPVWLEWSQRELTRALDDGVVAINPIIYAEVSVGFTRIEELDSFVPETDFRRLPLPYDAGFLAGKAFVAYRRRGGTRSAPLPDFYIGAHAATTGLRLLTRDAARYRTYFPTVELIAP